MGKVMRGKAWGVGALVSALALVGCGGGGGGSSSGGGNPVVDPKVASASVEGVASKGLLKQAVVKVFGVLPSGQLGELLQQTRTDSQGHYTVTGLPVGALVAIEVSADASTLMADEASGTDVAPPVGFRLRAASTLSTSGGRDVLQVTPFSEMAVAMAEANGGFKPDVVATANQRVNSYLSYNALTEEPKFDTSNRPLNGSALNLAAVATLVSQKSLPACQQGTVGAATACVVAEMSRLGVGDATLATQLGAARDRVAYSGTEVLPKPEAVPAPFLTETAKAGVAEAKALLQNIRSNGQQATTDVLTQRLNGLKASMSQVDNLTGGQGRFSEALSAVMGAAKRLQRPTSTVKGTFILGDAECNYSADANGLSPATQVSEIQSVRCLLWLGYDYIGSSTNADNTGSTWTEHDTLWEMVLTPGTTAGEFKITSRQIKQVVLGHSVWGKWRIDPVTGNYVEYVPGSYWTEVTSSSDLTSAWPATLTLQADAAGAIQQAAIQGAMAPWAKGLHQQVNGVRLSVGVSVQDGLTRIDLQGNLRAQQDGVTQAGLALAAPSFVLMRTAVPGDLSTLESDDQAGARLSLNVTATGFEGSTATGLLTVAFDRLSLSSRQGRGTATFLGTIKNAKAALLFDGKLVLSAPQDVGLAAGTPGAASQVVKAAAVLDVDGTLPIPGRADLVAHFTLPLDEAVERVMTGKYVQGADTVFLRATVAARTGETRSVQISTPSGITATYVQGVKTFNVLKGRDVLGVVNVDKARVDYADQTYEQF